MSTVATPDIVFVVVILVSALIGLARGLFREILSLLIWGGACVAALNFGSLAGAHFVAEVGVPLSGVLGFAGVFVLVLIVGALVQWVFAKLVASTGLTGTDRFLGFLFGGARGVLVCTVAIIALRPFFADAPWWRESVMRPEFAKVEHGLLAALTQTRQWLADPRAPELPNAEAPSGPQIKAGQSWRATPPIGGYHGIKGGFV